MNARRPYNSDLDGETWAALAHLLAAAAPAFDATAALHGIESRLRQRCMRRVVAACIAIILPSSVLATMYMAERVRPRQVAAAGESGTGGGLLAQTGLGAGQASGQMASKERTAVAGTAPVAGAQQAVMQVAKEDVMDVRGAPRLLWDDDWDQHLAETQEMLFSVEQSWRRAPDAAAALKHKLDGLEAELAEGTL